MNTTDTKPTTPGNGVGSGALLALFRNWVARRAEQKRLRRIAELEWSIVTLEAQYSELARITNGPWFFFSTRERVVVELASQRHELAVLRSANT
jgi:hypothetical protein